MQQISAIAVPLIIAVLVSALFELLKRKFAAVRELPTQGKQAVVLVLAFALVGVAMRAGLHVDGSSVLAGLASMGIYTLYASKPSSSA